MVNGPTKQTIDPNGLSGPLLDPFDIVEGSPTPATSCITYKIYTPGTTTTPSYLKLIYPDVYLSKFSAGTLTAKQVTFSYNIGA
jgi:hypothetical protein